KHMGEIKNYDELIKFFDQYDSGINYMDSHIGQILRLLKDKGLYEDLAIIITSDHGEAIGEFGMYAEHGTA
ncbi:sulfatase-like hydrolase/transferase, partial [Clostridium perfringens]